MSAKGSQPRATVAGPTARCPGPNRGLTIRRSSALPARYLGIDFRLTGRAHQAWSGVWAGLILDNQKLLDLWPPVPRLRRTETSRRSRLDLTTCLTGADRYEATDRTVFRQILPNAQPLTLMNTI